MRVSSRSTRASSPAVVAFLLLLSSASAAAGQEAWRNVGDLERALDLRDSATETLRLWCVAHQSRGDASIHAVRESTLEPPPGEILGLLGVTDANALRYRRVRLNCAGKTLSVADNWYRADALTPEMNETLDHTDRPFGAVVAPLGLHRRTLSSERLPTGSIFVLRRRAVLSNDRGQPFSVVQEAYTREMLDRP